MGSIGANRSGGNGGESTSQPTLNTFSYDIEDRAVQQGYDSAEAMVTEDLTANNDFYTRDSDMIEATEDMGYSVISNPNGEYFVVQDDRDDTDSEFIVYYETAGSSRYITRVRKA